MHPNTCLQDVFPVERVALTDLVSWGRVAEHWRFEENASVLQGGILSKVKGRGMEFEDVRPYQTGDDVRHIDWRVTARTGKPHTKRYIDERDGSLMVVVDFRPSLFFATFGVYKSVMATHIASFLLWMGNLKGDAIGLSLIDDEIIHLKPTRSRLQIMHLLKTLATHSRWDNPRAAPQIKIDKSLQLTSPDILYGLNTLKSGSKVILITDLRGLDTAQLQKLKMLAQYKKVSLILITDKLEETLPSTPFSMMYEGKRVDVRASLLEQKEHTLKFTERLEQIKQTCYKQSITFCHLRTHEPFLGTLIKTLRLKKK